MQSIRPLLIALCMTALCSASAIAAQEGTALCAETGGAWTECGSGCGPVTCANPPGDPSEPVMCPAVCTSMCACPDAALYWDDAKGCHDGASCTQSCGEGESWDADLDACCPDAIYEADCGCEEGMIFQETTDYDANGCLLGYGCECLPAEGECKEGESWDAELTACCPDAIYTADCWCEEGSYPQETTDYDAAGCLLGYGCECVPDSGATCDEGESWDADLSVCCSNAGYAQPCECGLGTYLQETPDYDADGCLLGYSCECVPDSGATCDEGESWDADLSVCCSNAGYAQLCECGLGTYLQETPDYDESGCLLGYGCECLPDAGGTCDEGDSWDVPLQACCPDAVYVSDCVCDEGFTYEETLDYDDQGCLLGYGCLCTPTDEILIIDNDGDGYASDVDCDDDDKTVHPDAVELCNGVDDDCDGQIDEGACETNPGQCDDDFDALCDMEPPTCDEGLLLAVQDGCYVCVDPSTCQPPGAKENALCSATGGTWNDCGCPAVTCSNPPPADGEEALPCPPSCWEVCECPEDTPIWDENAGCVALSVCEDEPASDAGLCLATGGNFNECGSDCDVFSCDALPSDGPHPCSAAAVCTAVCECPAEAPVWDADLGCITEAACGGETADPVTALCEATGGAMDECLSACPPDPCADEPIEGVDCLAVCVIGCACPADAPHWDEVAGCQAEPDCPELPGDGDEPGEDATCDAGESWDSTLEACCPDAQFVADCACDDGSAPQETQEYDDDGCFIGTGCTCDGDDPESTDETGGCAGGGGEPSLLWMLGLSGLALSTRRRTLTVPSAH
jgi:hypothetical protein